MILKEAEEIQSTDKFIQAGYVAEKQMAFYLKRSFRGTGRCCFIALR